MCWISHFKLIARSSFQHCDFSNPKERVQGGSGGITQYECENLGGCYDDTIPNVHWCFRENAGYSENRKCDFAKPKQRKSGGWGGIRKFECESLGYCYSDLTPNVPWCYKADGLVSSRNCDFSNPRERTKAGFPGISAKECVAKGHCFDDSKPNAHRCFKYNRAEQRYHNCDYTFQASGNRVDAGWPGITKEECLAKGNCFDGLTASAKFCFKKNRPWCEHV